MRAFLIMGHPSMNNRAAPCTEPRNVNLVITGGVQPHCHSCERFVPAPAVLLFHPDRPTPRIAKMRQLNSHKTLLGQGLRSKQLPQPLSRCEMNQTGVNAEQS